MFSKKRKDSLDDRLDRLGREIVRASAASEEDLESVVSSPFLFAVLRSRIASEHKRLQEGETWLTLLWVVWRSAPAMALVAVFAFVAFWSASLDTRTPVAFSVDSLLNTHDTGIGRVMFVDNGSMSSDEVLASILNEDEQEDPR